MIVPVVTIEVKILVTRIEEFELPFEIFGNFSTMRRSLDLII